ncbi:MAG: hypothetical protein M5T61_17665 [Acidimicrobiia bacterium]|nr:hypothetical protein [Acidimicrobiia bacterium]
MVSDPSSDESLRRVWHHAILPLLDEHYYGTKVDVTRSWVSEACLNAVKATTDGNASAENEPDEPAEGFERMSEQRLIDVQAWGVSSDVELTLDEIAEIERSGLAEVVAGAADGRFRIKTSSKVGLVVGDDWELRVLPHLPIPRLMFLLGYSRDEHGWKDVIAGFEEHDDLFSAMANAFSFHATGPWIAV